MSQLFGMHTRVYVVMDRMPGRTVHDYENIIARLHGIPAYVDQNIGILDEALQRGIVQPRNVVDLVSNQLAAQVAQDSSTTVLLAPFRQLPSNIPASEQTRLKNSATSAYEKEFIPAWKNLHDYIAAPYAAKARPQAGLGTIAGGQEYYATLVRRYTTTTLTPAQIHKIGEDELKRIETEMLTLTKETGFNGTLLEFEAKMAATPDLHFTSKDDMLIYCRNAAKIIEPNLPISFVTSRCCSMAFAPFRRTGRPPPLLMRRHLLRTVVRRAGST